MPVYVSLPSGFISHHHTCPYTPEHALAYTPAPSPGVFSYMPCLWDILCVPFILFFLVPAGCVMTYLVAMCCHAPAPVVSSPYLQLCNSTVSFFCSMVHLAGCETVICIYPYRHFPCYVACVDSLLTPHLLTGLPLPTLVANCLCHTIMVNLYHHLFPWFPPTFIVCLTHTTCLPQRADVPSCCYFTTPPGLQPYPHQFFPHTLAVCRSQAPHPIILPTSPPSPKCVWLVRVRV